MGPGRVTNSRCLAIQVTTVCMAHWARGGVANSLPPSSLPAPSESLFSTGVKGDGKGDGQGREDENMTLGSGFLPSGQTRSKVLTGVRVAWSPGFV